MSSDNPPHPPHDGHRRVSIVDLGHDNPAFDSPRSRKVSAANSEHTEIGPVRKKSILHNASHGGEYINVINDGKHLNGDAKKKHSLSDSVHSKSKCEDADEEIRSWWYSFCLKCRQKEVNPSWQPSIWSRICPYPFCPTYRQFSRIIALCLIGALSWCTLYTIVGDTAAPPSGHLYQIIFLSIWAWCGGWVIGLTTLPPLIGMLFTGLLFQNVGFVDLDESFTEITSELRKVALVILLIRAGLDLDPHALNRLRFTVLKLAVIPWFVEAAMVMIFSHFFMGLPWIWGALLGSIIAAVSPAVVVASLFRIRSKGYGVAKGIPTLIIAVAGIDDALSVAAFGVVKSFIESTDASLSSQIIQGPVSIIGGIGFGVLWGIICNYTPEKHDPFMIPLRVLLLLVGGLIAVFGSELVDYEGAGPLACVAAGFACLVFWSRQGWEIEDNPAATAFEIFWMLCEPVLFGITGAQVKLRELDGQIVLIGLGILVAGIVIRILVTVVVGIGCKLNTKEKVFVALSWMAKATVQAALGPVMLAAVIHKGGTSQETDYAEKVMMICVLSIMLTAPTAAIVMSVSGPRLLTKTKVPVVLEGWRRSHRPSIRDISIIDEEEERDTSNVEAPNSSRSKELSKSEP